MEHFRKKTASEAAIEAAIRGDFYASNAEKAAVIQALHRLPSSSIPNLERLVYSAGAAGAVAIAAKYLAGFGLISSALMGGVAGWAMNNWASANGVGRR
jgi:hypothetical protein